MLLVAMLVNMLLVVRPVNNSAAATLANNFVYTDRRGVELVAAFFPTVLEAVFYAVWDFHTELYIFFFVVAFPRALVVAAFPKALVVLVSARLRIYWTRQKYLHRRTTLHPPHAQAFASCVHNLVP